MTPNPITKALSTIRKHRLRSLVMGGQACVFYGAAEFSRDLDLALNADAQTLEHLQAALDELQAKPIAVPPFDPAYLERGHAIHFRCHAPGVERLRIDIMTHLRGVDPFPQLWERRTVIETEGLVIDLLSLPDLVAAKRTQRDKDWPMTNRLIEAHYIQNAQQPSPEHIEFWLTQSFDLDFLEQRTAEYPAEARQLASRRTVLAHLLEGDTEAADLALYQERQRIRQADRTYWQPLIKELHSLRRSN